MATLEEYRRKRDFERTPEPSGELRPSRGQETGLYVVQKHAARRLHYDLRLEYNGVLQSWAVPKGPSLDPGEKRLAVRVEDHPLDYADFEGVIPEGDYGAGTVMLWDRGRFWATRRDPDRLDFVLEGRKLHGAWTLVRMARRGGENGDNWLLIKRRDREARRRVGSEAESLSPEVSVATGRTMEQIAADRARTWTSRGEDKTAAARPDPGTLTGARRKKPPRELRPQLASLVRAAPSGAGWVHEIKFDGYRILAWVEGGKARLVSRNGKDWTARFPEIAALVENLAAEVLLDGEIVAFEANGATSFRRLQEALSTGRTRDLVYQVFDLLYLNGFDLTGVALGERKHTLERLLASAGFVGSASLRYTDHIEGKGPAFFDQVCRLGLEGIVSKRVDARYRAGRGKSWLKVKCIQHEELVVGGYTEPSRARAGFGALLLGAFDGDRLVYAGKVGTGFSERQLDKVYSSLGELEVPDCPFEPAPAGRGLHWVRPELVAEVEFTEWTRDGVLRHPSFRGLREDRDPKEIRMPAAAAGERAPRPIATAVREKRDTQEVAGVRLSHPDRVLYPEQGVTKLALAHYYEDIADWILPQLRDRPLSLLRCPEGRGKECFFQKHPRDVMAKSIPRVEIREKEGPAPYLYVRRIPDLVALVQTGTLELHVWGSRVQDVERPDLVVFDLDPGPDVPWTEMLRAVVSLKERLSALGLESFVRTTGGKGLHVVVPLVPERGWEDVKAFAQAVAEAHARDDRRRLTVNMAKSKRRGRIFIDYLRNGRGATAIASYSTRAREGAPVAVPVRWEELSPALRSDRYSIENLRRRLWTLGADPWEGFEKVRRPLTRRILESVGVTGATGGNES